MALSEEPLRVEEKILRKFIRLLPDTKTHYSRAAKEIECRKDIVGLDYAEVKCTRDMQAQDYKTEVEEGLIMKKLSEDAMRDRTRDEILSAETREGYKRAIREETPLSEVAPYHIDRRKWVSDPYPHVETCIKFLDRYHLECLKDNLPTATSPCEKIEVLANCARDTSLSPAVAATIVDVPHSEAVKCYSRLQEEGKVFKTEKQPAAEHLAVCAGERQFQKSV